MIINGNALNMPLDDESVDTIITDPPYGLTFMGKEWDKGVPGEPFWREALRVAKPGAFLLAFGGTRTYHRLTCAIEDAGWQIRDCMMWLYGSGFPKSHNLKDAFEGWGTALKPAWEPIIVAMKPLDGTFAHNAEQHGVAGLWIDGGRIETSDKLGGGMVSMGRPKMSQGWDRPWMHDAETTERKKAESAKKVEHAQSLGRWPANVILDEVAGELLDRQTGEETSRFFYCAKASRKERNAGLDSPSSHPTVKPVALMRYLVRLTRTPTGGMVLDPFCGSGTTGVACAHEGREFVGVELNPEYAEIARRRCEHAIGETAPQKARLGPDSSDKQVSLL